MRLLIGPTPKAALSRKAVDLNPEAIALNESDDNTSFELGAEKIGSGFLWQPSLLASAGAIYGFMYVRT